MTVERPERPAGSVTVHLMATSDCVPAAPGGTVSVELVPEVGEAVPFTPSQSSVNGPVEVGQVGAQVKLTVADDAEEWLNGLTFAGEMFGLIAASPAEIDTLTSTVAVWPKLFVTVARKTAVMVEFSPGLPLNVVEAAVGDVAVTPVDPLTRAHDTAVIVAPGGAVPMLTVVAAVVLAEPV